MSELLPQRTFVLDPVSKPPEKAGSAEAKSFAQMQEALSLKIGTEAVVSSSTVENSDSYLQVKSEKIVEALKFLRDDLAFQCVNLHVVSAVDYPATEENKNARIEIVYVVSSFVHGHQFMLKVFLGRESPCVDSITALFRVANFHERECYDLLGVVFKGHPNLKRILLPDDWVGHPLRKDYVFPEEYNGMKVPL